MIDGNAVTLYVRRRDEPQELPDNQIEATLRAVEMATGNGMELKLAAAHELLDTFNESWREDQPVHTAAEFAARMTLRTIEVEPDGERATFTYADGDLFWGHAIRVGMQLKDMVVDDVSI